MHTTPQILIVGAGASFGARVGCADAPPLGIDLPVYLKRWLDENEQFFFDATPRTGTLTDFRWRQLVGGDPRDVVHEFLEEASGEERGFERAMARLLGSQHLYFGRIQEINRVLGLALASGRHSRIITRPDLYDQLLSKLYLLHHSLTVVSFNYEQLLEEAAVRVLRSVSVGNAVNYGDSQYINGADGPLRVYKPHGSLNWFDAWGFPGGATNPDGPDEEWLFHQGNFIGSDSGKIYATPCLSSAVEILTDRNSPSVMAQYCPGKIVPQNRSALDALRSECLEEIEASVNSEVTVIGLCPPQDDTGLDDPFLSRLLAALSKRAKRATYVSPSTRDCARARAFGLACREETLSEFLRSS